MALENPGCVDLDQNCRRVGGCKVREEGACMCAGWIIGGIEYYDLMLQAL